MKKIEKPYKLSPFVDVIIFILLNSWQEGNTICTLEFAWHGIMILILKES